MLAAKPVRRRTSALVAVGIAMGMLPLAAAPVWAKVFLEGRFDAPVSFQSPPGEELLVGVTLTIPEGLEEYVDLDGSPVVLLLHGPKGDTTRAEGAMDAKPGHYAFRIEVPDGGPRTLEVLVGEGLPVFLTTDPFTFGPIREGTAQLASGGVPAAPPVPANPPAVPPVDPAAAPPVDPAAAPVAPVAPPVATAPSPAILAVAIVALGLLVTAVGLLVARSGRARSADLPRQAPGG
jgi:hypothetical protein